MKIAQVTHRYHPNIGGIETHVKEISERLARDHEVEVLTADLSPSVQRTEILGGVKISRFPSLHPANTIYFSPQMKSYLEKNAFDIIHAHNYHAMPALSASRAAKDNLVFTPHYHGRGSSAFTSVLLRPYSHFGRQIFRKAERVICVSGYEKTIVQRDFAVPDSRISVIPNGIDTNPIQEARPFDPVDHLILSVGRLDRYKNIDLIVKAMPFLPDFTLYIIGRSGSAKKDLQRLITRLELTKRVRILDTVSDEDKNRWLKTCSLFVNLSDMEAFGITVLEAIAAGKPVIVNNAGGLAELAMTFREQIIPVNRSDYASEQSFRDLASLMAQKAGGTYHQDLTDYDWDTISKRVEGVYFLVRQGKIKNG
jgi:glycosyltransferase involved in cell wall biosynthesis